MPGYMWINLINPSSESMRDLQALIDSQSEIVAADIVGQILALRSRAARGLLRADHNEIQNMKLHPELFELKWRFVINSTKVEIRQYHGEPTEVADLLVASHMHTKRLDGTATQIRQWQNDEIEYARHRYSLWSVPKW